MAEEEVKLLKNILQDQKTLIQKLQAELEEERKAVATGAEEALSMILRLQQEKSTQNMESLQYKRIAGEKLQHSEEALAVMREIVFLKDCEIEAVRYQLGVFRSKLMSLCVDGGNLGSFSWSNGCKFGKKGQMMNLGRKNVSLPSVRFEELCSEIDGFNFDDWENKSLVREISGEFSFSPIRLNCANNIPQRKSPRRTSSSSVVLYDSCKKAESFGSTSVDKFEAPEILKRAKEYNQDFADLEDFAVRMRCVESEMKGMRESNEVASSKQLELLVEIRDKITALESHIQQRDDDRIIQPSNNQTEESLLSYYMEAMLSWYM